MGSRVARRPPRGSASAARVAALGVLGEVRRRDARARDLMRRSESLSRLDARDKGLAERLVLGVVATSGRLDAALGAYLARPGSLEPRVRDALRVSAFELMYLGTAGAVAVSQGVELVRGVAPRACGLANAVLRRVAEKDAPLVAEARARVDEASADACDLALVAGWPEWLARDLVGSLGVPACCEMAACSLDPAPVWVSGNAALHSPDEVPAMLRAAGLERGMVYVVCDGLSSQARQEAELFARDRDYLCVLTRAQLCAILKMEREHDEAGRTDDSRHGAERAVSESGKRL